MTKSGLAVAYDIATLESFPQSNAQELWKPKIVNFIQAPANQSNSDTKRYKAAFRKVTAEDREEFKNSKVILPISVGQKYHEEGEFEATINLINKSFKECTILVADTLRRHWLSMSEYTAGEEELFSLARMGGDKWLERNAKFIQLLSVPYTITRWNDWIEHPEYNDYYNQVIRLYNDDTEYKDVVHKTIQMFLLRGGRYSSSNDSHRDACLRYILEESAVTCLWIKSEFKFDIYPTGDNEPMLQASKKLIGIHGYRSLSLNIKKR